MPKDDCRKTIEDKKIIHILIDNYFIDNSLFMIFLDKYKCENFSLDLSFICLPNNLIKNLKKILKNYQISINQFLSASYVKGIFFKMKI